MLLDKVPVIPLTPNTNVVCAIQFRWVYESNKIPDPNRIFSHLPFFFVYLSSSRVSCAPWTADNKEALVIASRPVRGHSQMMSVLKRRYELPKTRHWKIGCMDTKLL